VRRLSAIASVLLAASTFLPAAPPKPSADFWYVVPGGSGTRDAGRAVRGIVLPSAAAPTVRTTPSGAVLTWQTPAGAKQSLVVTGVSALTLEPGPIDGTTYVPFVNASRLQLRDPDWCCSCASWKDMEESFERLTCVPGCKGCGCEACICDPSSPCPESLAQTAEVTLVAHDDPSSTITIGKAASLSAVTMTGRGEGSATFRGARVSTRVNASGETEIVNPDSITLEGQVSELAAERRDKSLFAWTAPGVSVILEQPREAAKPTLRGSTIDLAPRARPGAAVQSTRLEVDPLGPRCRVCGTHPNSWADVDAMQCVAGDALCYRCISWQCDVPEE
jgi:hypothetical protein